MDHCTREMIQTNFFPQPEKDKPIKIIQIEPSGLQPIKVEEINHRDCCDVLPDTYMLYPTGGYHPFYGVPNTFPRYQLPIWPCIKRIKWAKQPRNNFWGHLKAILNQKGGYVGITLQKKGYYNANQYERNWRGLARNKSSYNMHSLVANAWVPNPDNKKLVLHINDDPTNYLPENLIWGTQRDNMKGVKKTLETPEQKYLGFVNKGFVKG